MTEVHPPSLLAKQYLDAFLQVYDKKTQENLDLAQLSVQCDDVASNKHHFVYRGHVIRRKNKWFARYHCVACRRENHVSLNHITSKIDRNKSTCHTCGTIDIIMPHHEDAVDFSSLPSSRLLVEKMRADERLFWHQDQGFRQHYLKKNMMTSDFERLRPFILSFQNDKLAHDPSRIVFIPYFRNGTTPRCFEPMIYDVTRDVIEKPIHVRFVCHLCGYAFLSKNMQPYRKKHHILCKKCETDHSPTKKRSERNTQGGMVHYKTPFQHKFLKYCLQHDILCLDGNEELHGYTHDVFPEPRVARVHYILPRQRTWVDVVGNKEFQPYDCRRTCTLREAASARGCSYVQLYPKNYVKWTRFWNRVSLFSPSVNSSAHATS